ncbi:MAG: DNA-binding protein Alba [Candidatus Bathyarchaeota archaeon]|nr:DNA-binding protein Alba [Candidatus Bathyarchaeota archaeon]
MSENVYIGSKPILNYVTAIASALQRAENVTVKARGRAISSAVDVVEVTRNRFLPDIIIDGIDIGTERLEGENGERNVSTIVITLSRGKR